MRTIFSRAAMLAFLVFLPSSWANEEPRRPGAGQEKQVGVVSHVKVVSDKVHDVSSMEAWKRSFIRDGMTDREKALAIWKTVVMFQHQDEPPVEFLHHENTVLDAIKMFNVYGESYCGVAASHVQSLSRYAGLKTRGWTISRHVVPEVYWDGSWHLLDASLVNYFPKADGKIASVKEIVAAVNEWFENNPGYKGNDAKLRAFMRADGWSGWKRGPELLARCPFYDATGWYPARTHGWYSTMQEYDGSTLFEYECGYSQGYQVNIQLRRGERLTRNWFNKGLHVNMLHGGPGPGCLNAEAGKGSLIYTPKYGDLGPGRVGNGTLEYDVPLADGAFRTGALVAENMVSGSRAGRGTAVRVDNPERPAVLVIRMPSSYIYLSGELTFKAIVPKEGAIRVSFSDNNGLDWKRIAGVRESGVQRVDLKSWVGRRYDYRLKFELEGKGTGLDALRIAHDIQHSQRALPALGEGSNTITFSSRRQEGTITVEGSTDLPNKGKQLVYTNFHPVSNGIEPPQIKIAGAKGDITFPIETPGPMTRLRFGSHYRARHPEKDGWDLQVSFDGGRTFKTVDRCAGPGARLSKYITYSDVPPNTKKAWIRYAGTQRTVTMLMNVRIDADYKEPRGGFRPIKITYRWEEGGQGKKHVHVARKAQETYTITCGARPVMKSIVLERAE